MNKLKYFILAFLSVQLITFADYNSIYIADIQYDWINKTQVEKEAIINEIKDIIFVDGEIQKKENLKQELKEFMQDKEYKKHYIAASAGLKECGEYNISAFYYKNQTHIYMYALQDKKDLSKILINVGQSLISDFLIIPLII